MPRLLSLSKIKLPRPSKEKIYTYSILGQSFSFKGLKRLLGAADFNKAGDRNAGLSAPSELAREAARSILSSLTLEHIYDHPFLDNDGDIDEVMKVNYAIDLAHFSKISSKTVGELKDLLLKSDGEELKKTGRALTGVMVAAVTKLLDVHELIFISKKITCTTKARTTLGLPNSLSSRLQPNHPTDDLQAMRFLFYTGISIGSGDALLGVNPAIDTVENTTTILRHLDALRRKHDVPTQICVLSHLKTQLECLKRKAPVEIMFQSLAGTESTLLTEFDVSIDLLDRAYEAMALKGPLGKSAKQFMYFETGQGSEFTYGKHNGIDMTTTEALCYGIARRYDPFMVNNVTGFIGPETHLDNFEMIVSNLQDHFMGKLMGLPMGMAPCYTLHSNITLEGQQMATQMLTAAGANYYMDVCFNTDRMLAYFDTSGHDDQTLREIYGKVTTPEYQKWALSEGIFKKSSSGVISRGNNWGNFRRFCKSDREYQDLLKVTPAFYEFKNAGPRPINKTTRNVRVNQAAARDAIRSELRIFDLKKNTSFRTLETMAKTKDIYLQSPNLGSVLDKKSEQSLKSEKNHIQVIVSDGLSAEAIHSNALDILTVLGDGFKNKKIKVGRPVLVRYARVKLAEVVAKKLQSYLTIFLIGERPGGDAISSRSLSAYLLYQLKDKEIQKKAAKFSGNSEIKFEYTVISNIYDGGIPPSEAGSIIVEKSLEILKNRAAGNRLEGLKA